jgi:hypothetical protein
MYLMTVDSGTGDPFEPREGLPKRIASKAGGGSASQSM